MVADGLRLDLEEDEPFAMRSARLRLLAELMTSSPDGSSNKDEVDPALVRLRVEPPISESCCTVLPGRPVTGAGPVDEDEENDELDWAEEEEEEEADRVEGDPVICGNRPRPLRASLPTSENSTAQFTNTYFEKITMKATKI